MFEAEQGFRGAVDGRVGSWLSFVLCRDRCWITVDCRRCTFQTAQRVNRRGSSEEPTRAMHLCYDLRARDSPQDDVMCSGRSVRSDLTGTRALPSPGRVRLPH